MLRQHITAYRVADLAGGAPWTTAEFAVHLVLDLGLVIVIVVRVAQLDLINRIDLTASPLAACPGRLCSAGGAGCPPSPGSRTAARRLF